MYIFGEQTQSLPGNRRRYNIPYPLFSGYPKSDPSHDRLYMYKFIVLIHIYINIYT